MYYLKTSTIDFESNRNFCIYKIDGLNPPSATLNFSTIANVDGEIYNSGRINKRNIVLYIKIYEDVETNRNELYNHFPIGKQVRIFFRNGMHNVYIDGYVESFECDFFTNNEIAQISIICNDPYFRGVEKEITLLSVIMSGFEFPFSIPVGDGVELNTINYNAIEMINAGSVSTGIIVEFEAIDARVQHPSFTNLTTNQTMKLTGSDSILDIGEKIIVNTNKNNLSITKVFADGKKKNILNTMDDHFDWVQLAAGENLLTYAADEKPENLVVRVTLEKLFLGV